MWSGTPGRSPGTPRRSPRATSRPPGSGAHAREEGEIVSLLFNLLVFPRRSGDGGSEAQTIVAFGDSITDGTASTSTATTVGRMCSRAASTPPVGNRFSVVNEGIGGNMVVGPTNYAAQPFAGGPAATERLERDLLSLPHVAKVIFLEGIDDFGNAGAESREGRAGRARLRRQAARTNSRGEILHGDAHLGGEQHQWRLWRARGRREAPRL